MSVSSKTRGYPSFWNPDNVRNPLYVPNLGRAREEGRKAGLEKVSRQLKRGGSRNALILIDFERDFGDKGRLPVTGAYDDAVRLGERLIKGTLDEFYTDLIATIDVHPSTVIHGDTWWADEMGNPPDVSFPLFMVLIDDNVNRPVFEANWVDGRPKKKYSPTLMRTHTVKYAKHLQATGQGNIWVFTAHCREGTDGINLVPALAELIEWASTARGYETMFMHKGHIAHVDWFGPFRPCMDVPDHPQGGIQTAYLDVIKECATTEIAGEAEDFCVNAGVLQVLDYYNDQPDVLRSIKFIGDCTSAIVPNSDVVTNLHATMKQKGVQVIMHDSPFGAV